MQQNIFEKLSIKTPYRIEDIIEFFHLSGLNTEDKVKTIIRFSEIGISNLVDVNILLKLGFLDIPKNTFKHFSYDI